LISVWIGFYQLVKQQGRMLLRLDELERNARAAGAGAEEAAEPDGLPLGTDFPAFRFPDLAGRTVALEDFRGKRVLLVHWNFDCGFCESIARDLGQLDTSLQEQNVQLVLLTYGSSESNQEQVAEHGLKCPVLLINDKDRPAPFANQGTPVAYLLDEQGQVAWPFVSGADQVIALAQHCATNEFGILDAGKRQIQRRRLPG